MKRRRREVLLGAAASVTAVASLPAPAIAQGIKELKLVTSWPKGTPGLQTSAERLAQSITTLSDGRLKITVYPADSLVRSFEVFDAVAAGAADMYHTDEAYFETKAPALNFFSAVPYGLTADELCSWIDFGGGQTLWDEVDAHFNIKPLMACNTGSPDGRVVQQGGQHSGGFQGPALSDARARRRGPAPHGRHRGDDPRRRDRRRAQIRRDRRPSGSAPGWTWILGCDKAADYYYYPGFHEPGYERYAGHQQVAVGRIDDPRTAR